MRHILIMQGMRVFPIFKTAVYKDCSTAQVRDKYGFLPHVYVNKKAVPALVVVAVAASLIVYGATMDIAPRDDGGRDDGVYVGALRIINSEHRIGENVFTSVNGLKEGQEGMIGFFTPEGKLYTEIPFNGSAKTSFNYYFTPRTSSGSICNVEQLTGTWTVIWKPPYYPRAEFEVGPEWLEGEDMEDYC